MQWDSIGSLPTPHANTMVSPEQPSTDGLTMEKYPPVVPQPILDNLKSPMNLTPVNLQKTSLQLQDSISSTFESLLTNKKTILNDKKSFYLKNIPLTKQSEISGQGSTTKDMDLSPFWNGSKEVLSEKLWLPQKIDSAGSGLISLNGSAILTGQKSWFSNKITQPRKKNSLQNCWTSSKFSAVGEMVKEDTITKTLRIKLRLKPHQKKILETWSHHNRYTFNMTIEQIEKGVKNKRKLRDKLVTSEALPENRKWLLETPKVIRQQAVFKAHSNYKTAVTNYKSGLTNKFQFQKKKNNLWTMGIEKQISINKNGEMTMFKNKPFNFGSFKAIDKVFKRGINHIFEPKGKNMKPRRECNIHRDDYNRYYLIVPYTVKKQNPPKNERIVSLDPGLRKFLTAYSPDGEYAFLGINCRDRLFELFSKIEIINNLLSTELTTSINRKRLRRRKLAVYRKLGDLKRELHNKMINYLTTNYTSIVLGKINTKELVNREKSILRAKEKILLYSLGHYEFRCKLANACKSKGLNLYVVNEAWTSKTCTKCGLINKKLGGSETFNCSQCDNNVDRDVNGARNILIRNLHEL